MKLYFFSGWGSEAVLSGVIHQYFILCLALKSYFYQHIDIYKLSCEGVDGGLGLGPDESDIGHSEVIPFLPLINRHLSHLCVEP